MFGVVWVIVAYLILDREKKRRGLEMDAEEKREEKKRVVKKKKGLGIVQRLNPWR